MNYALVPRPRWSEGRDGSLTLRSPVRIRCADEWVGVVEVFEADLAAAVGWRVQRVVEGDCDIALRYDVTKSAEAYGLDVAERIELSASDATGFAYAFTLLRQLGPPALWSSEVTALATWTVPAMSVVDAPSFAWRGVHLDVARHFFDVTAVLRLIDVMAAHRLNRLHLHLNDDQGWRIEVPDWPELTTVGAWRSGSPIGHERDGRGDGVPHGGFYRASDVAVILEHARRRHVQVVPEIDLPGHAQAVLAAYPQFANSAERVEVWTHWGISHHILNVEPATLSFVEDVVRYVARLFCASAVHIGGDECPSTPWACSPAARAVMAEHGMTRARQLQGLYTERLTRALSNEGREVLAWDEVLDAAVTPGTTICAWRSVQKGVEAAERGLDVIMAPMQYLYFDWLSSESPDEPVAVATPPRVTTWEKVYRYNVIPDALDPALHHQIRGAQVQLWTEYIDSRARLDYMAFPRLCAFAEVVWGTAGDLGEFRSRLEGHLRRLDAMGVAYRALDRE